VGLCRQQAAGFALETAKLCRAGGAVSALAVQPHTHLRVLAASFMSSAAKTLPMDAAQETDEALQRRLAARCEAVTAAAPEGCPPKAAIRLLLEHIQALSWRFCNVVRHAAVPQAGIETAGGMISCRRGMCCG